jgi:hypothetical protein
MQLKLWLLSIGDKYIRARKLVRGPTDLMYITTERDYNLHAEDVRVINMKHKEVIARRSSRRAQTSNKKTYMFDERELEALKCKCWRPLNQ